jgi:hypothetical protein
MSDAKTSEKAFFADYWTEDEFAKQRGLSTRTLRSERARGAGPPYLIDGRSAYYSIEKARAWLLQKEHNPVREPQAPRVSLRRRKDIPHRTFRKRALAENATA